MILTKVFILLVMLVSTKASSMSDQSPLSITEMAKNLPSSTPAEMRSLASDSKRVLSLNVVTPPGLTFNYDFTIEMMNSFQRCLCNDNSFSCKVNVLDRVVEMKNSFSHHVRTFFCGELKDASMGCWRMTPVEVTNCDKNCVLAMTTLGENSGTDGVAIVLAGNVEAIVTAFGSHLGALYRCENVTCLNVDEPTTTAAMTWTSDNKPRPESTDNDTTTNTIVIAICVPVGALVLVAVVAVSVFTVRRKRIHSLSPGYALYRRNDSAQEGHIIEFNTEN